MAGTKGRLTEAIPKHRILREIYRHYIEYRELVTSSGESVIEHGYFIYDEEGKEIVGQEMVTISFWDLYDALEHLSKRKREAFFYNVILDYKQRDVADIMGITTVSVGQYVEQACLQMAEKYFADEESEDESAGSKNHNGGMGRQGRRTTPPRKT